jgi:RHS repeat-associated protein
MKTCVLIASLLLGATFGARSQTDPGVASNFVYSIVENGPHSRVWERVSTNSSPADDPNQPHPHLSRYTCQSGPLASANLYRFSSKEFHPNSGLIYYLYRSYDPNLQGWPNRDPLMESGFYVSHARRNIQHFGFSREFAEQIEGPNLYEFVANDSIDSEDGTGLIFMPPQPRQPNQNDGTCSVACMQNGIVVATATFGASWNGNRASRATGQACCDQATALFCGMGATAAANFMAATDFSNCMRRRCGAPPSGQRPGGLTGPGGLPGNN